MSTTPVGAHTQLLPAGLLFASLTYRPPSAVTFHSTRERSARQKSPCLGGACAVVLYTTALRSNRISTVQRRCGYSAGSLMPGGSVATATPTGMSQPREPNIRDEFS